MEKVLLAIVTIIVLTGINIRGVSVSQWLANVFTGLKLLAIGGIIVLGFLFFDAERVPLDFSPGKRSGQLDVGHTGRAHWGFVVGKEAGTIPPTWQERRSMPGAIFPGR